jgi:hypothetical protein
MSLKLWIENFTRELYRTVWLWSKTLILALASSLLRRSRQIIFVFREWNRRFLQIRSMRFQHANAIPHGTYRRDSFFCRIWPQKMQNLFPLQIKSGAQMSLKLCIENFTRELYRTVWFCSETLIPAPAEPADATRRDACFHRRSDRLPQVRFPFPFSLSPSLSARNPLAHMVNARTAEGFHRVCTHHVCACNGAVSAPPKHGSLVLSSYI